ncbi:ATP-binding protein [Alkalicoccus chagannorensis]|uniref:ATP-binding protein n=1 Tax=Alkalicoccus chagannorensis TaxID=427072 RepID=UPI0003F91277|nr:ATP-binding protein [Alkalicoccus chagannorensis]
MTTTTWQLFSSDTTDSRIVNKEIRDLIKHYMGEDARLFDVAAGEAVLNSVTYPPDTAVASVGVHIRLTRQEGKLTLRIRDPGPGFDYKPRLCALKQSKEETIVAGLHEEGGRGILLMYECSDRLFFNRDGNDVLLVKHCPSEND